jgi:haloalkane dehalogenase
MSANDQETFVRPDWLPESIFPFQSRFVELLGAKVHYVEQGKGPVFLGLHGNPTWSFLYRKILPELSGQFRAISMDYPGFGLSEPPAGYKYTPAEHADVLEAFIRELDLKNITMMVQDWGGPIGMAVAGRMPERFDRFVIGNTWAWPANGDKDFERFANMMGGTIGTFLIRHFNAFVNVMIPVGTKKKVSREAMRAYRAPFPTADSRNPTHVFPREIIGSTKFLAEVEKGLDAILDKPAIIVWGDKDPAFRKKELQRWQSLFPKAETTMLKGAGHYIQEDAPEKIVKAVLDWVK